MAQEDENSARTSDPTQRRDPRNSDPLQITLMMKRAEAHISRPLADSNLFFLRRITTAGTTNANCHNPGWKITTNIVIPVSPDNPALIPISSNAPSISRSSQIATPFFTLFPGWGEDTSVENSGFSSMLHSYRRAQRRQSRLFQAIAIKKIVSIERNQP